MNRFANPYDCPHTGSWSERKANARKIADGGYEGHIPGPYRVLRYHDEHAPRSIVASHPETNATRFIVQENIHHDVDSATLQLLADAPNLLAENLDLKQQIAELKNKIHALEVDRQNILNIISRDTFNSKVVLGLNTPEGDETQ